MSKARGIYFTKMEGAGNDYVYVDALGSPTSLPITETDITLPDLAKKISDRHFGVGGDGLVVIMPSDSADFRMRMFNADGSEAQMCGNASRCIAKYVHDKGFTSKTSITLETLSGIKVLNLHLDAEGNTSQVTVDMGEAKFKRCDIPAKGDVDSLMIDDLVHADDADFLITGIGMGNPHGVIFVDSITDRHIHHYGRLLEISDVWPEKANIEFVKVIDPRHIEMRVWERGSGETLACGTGSCACVVAAFTKGLTGNIVDVKLLGGTLHIEYNPENKHVYMSGPAEFVADGEYYYKIK